MPLAELHKLTRLKGYAEFQVPVGRYLVTVRGREGSGGSLPTGHLILEND